MKKQGFTLIELIVVITILAILGTIAFISFKGFSGDARNTKITADLSNLQTGLSLYKTQKGVLPIPDNSKTVIAGTGNNITLEGEIGEVVKNQINADKNTKSSDGGNYKYATNSDRKKFILIGGYEEISVYNEVVKAESETKIFKGDDVLTLFNIAGDFVEGDITDLKVGEEVFFGDEKMPIESKKPILKTCKQLLDYKLGSTDGNYKININGNLTNVYCDMTTDGGGYTYFLYDDDADKTNTLAHRFTSYNEMQDVCKSKGLELFNLKSTSQGDKLRTIIEGQGYSTGDFGKGVPLGFDFDKNNTYKSLSLPSDDITDKLASISGGVGDFKSNQVSTKQWCAGFGWSATGIEDRACTDVHNHMNMILVCSTNDK